MKKLLPILFFVTPLVFGMASCSKGEEVILPVEQTVFMYLPWSNNLTEYFYGNISDFEKTLGNMKLPGRRVLAFISESPEKGVLLELRGSNGTTARRTLKYYKEPALTTREWITSVLEDVKRFAPAGKYAMTIGCHGMGWIPVESVRTASLRAAPEEKFHWEYDTEPGTRFFGGIQSQYQTDVTTLAEGIAGAGMKMEYILFDDCYMSGIEVAYDLKDVAGHLIACPTEIMAVGMPYSAMGEYLLGNIDYESAAGEFHSFFSAYDYPYGTIAVTVCSEVESLAEVMKEINNRFAFNESLRSSLQSMDGYSPVIFFDMGSYVSKLCTDPALLARFETQLEKTVPAAYKRHTSYYYTNSRGQMPIFTYSGTTISDPSVNPKASAKTGTAWYKATH